MAPTPDGTEVVEHEVRIAASPDTLFAYFTDPSKMVEWMGAEATLDPRPGGICRIAFAPSEAQAERVRQIMDAERPAAAEAFTAAMSGRFLEVDPPHRLALTWGWEVEILAVPPQSTEVEVTFTPDGDETVVRLIHRRIPAAAVSFHEMGWGHYLGRLELVAAGTDPGPDPWQVALTARPQ